MAVEDTPLVPTARRSRVSPAVPDGGRLAVSTTPSISRLSNESFPVPGQGSITRFRHDRCPPSWARRRRPRHPRHLRTAGCADDPVCAAGKKPWRQSPSRASRRGATLHMIDFATGQLFDWFLSAPHAIRPGRTAAGHGRGSPSAGPARTMYTQIVKKSHSEPGPHDVAIRSVAIGASPTSTSRSTDPGCARQARWRPSTSSELASRASTPSLGRGSPRPPDRPRHHRARTVQLLDAFPFQHPDAPSAACPSDQRTHLGSGAVRDVRRLRG